MDLAKMGDLELAQAAQASRSLKEYQEIENEQQRRVTAAKVTAEQAWRDDPGRKQRAAQFQANCTLIMGVYQDYQLTASEVEQAQQAALEAGKLVDSTTGRVTAH